MHLCEIQRLRTGTNFILKDFWVDELSSINVKIAQFNCSVLAAFPGKFPATSINLLLVAVIVN